MSPRLTNLKAVGIAAAVLSVFALVAFQAAGASAPEMKKADKANYELASRFTAAKVGKLVFDTAVQPHWLESGDRFWYGWETSKGRSFTLVDPLARSKAPLFDNARMAAQLTEIVLTPYDSEHLPFKTVKFIDKDTALRLELEVQKDSDVRLGDKIVKAGDIEKKREDAKKAKEDAAKTAEEKEREKKEQDKKDLEKKDLDKKDADKGKEKEPEKKTTTLYFEYRLATGKLSLLPDYKAPPKRPRWASVSPDEKSVVFVRGFNLFMMDAENFAKALKKADDATVKEVQLTTDGEEHFSYARDLMEEDKKELQKDEKDRKDYRVPAGFIVWSKDSKKFATVREDERKVGDLWVINSLANPRPTLETYRYAMPGEEGQPQPELLVFDLASKGKVKVKADAFKDQTLSIETAPRRDVDREKDNPPPAQWLSETSDKLYFGRQSRDLHKYDVCVADTATGDVKVLIEERLNTYVETEPLRLVNGGQEMVWWSERDGWGHYYLYGGDGKLKTQITSGEFTCQGIEGVDEKTRVLYFNACGREPNEDPYDIHLYRVELDGTGLKLLNPGDANHSSDADDALRVFIDTYSRVNTAPVSELRDLSGTLLLKLETTDTSALVEAGYKFPEPFKVKADDGVTDLYGVMYKPFDFDPAEKYPIIAYVYPGPADRERDQDVLAAERQRRPGPARLHRHRGRQPRRQPHALEVVPQLRLRQPPRLRPGRQEAGHRAAGASSILTSTSTGSASTATPAAGS